MDIGLQTQDFKGTFVTGLQMQNQHIRIYKCYDNTITCLTDDGQGLYSVSDVIPG